MAEHVDNVARMQELLERHADWHWTPAPRLGADHVVEYRLNGQPERAAHDDLGKLVAYMAALDRSTMSGIS
jgi:hypothetical protein